ncbi:GL26466 [Drosophila persimilis]|uniref:GL26466 n=1 Tax=Drosophila persimilis TaxID=7234 RepID=B4GSL2_DROPE|nr:GL26466 [Drosophila persimilis]
MLNYFSGKEFLGANLNCFWIVDCGCCLRYSSGQLLPQHAVFVAASRIVPKR